MLQSHEREISCPSKDQHSGIPSKIFEVAVTRLGYLTDLIDTPGEHCRGPAVIA